MNELVDVTKNNTRPELLSVLAERKMARFEDEVEVWTAVTGQTFESLPLSGDLTLKREVTDESTRNSIEMSYQVTGIGNNYTRYEKVITTPDGKVVYEPCDESGHNRPLSGFRRAILIIKLLKGRPDHWDKESDFYETVEEG